LELVLAELEAQILQSFLPPLCVRTHCSERAQDIPSQLHAREDAAQQGAVLFLDISGFTAMTEKLARAGSAGIEELTKILNSNFGRLIQLVDEYGGEVVSFAGDAMTAVFVVHHQGGRIQMLAQRAAACAVAMQSECRLLRKRENHSALAFKIGIGIGDIKASHLGGNANRWLLLVKGTAIKNAIDAEGYATPGETIASPQLIAALTCEWEGVEAEESPKAHIRLRFCHDPLAVPPPAGPNLNAEAMARLQSYLPRTVQVRLDAKQSAWMGELRESSVLFINLPTIVAKTAIDQQQSAISLVQERIVALQGEINKISLDEKGVTVLAVFGLPPLVHEDDPERAIKAAMQILDAFGDDAESLPQRARHGVSIGVTTGPVFAGIIGSNRRREFTVMGDVVNLSARLMQVARGSVVCDTSTRDKTATAMEFETLPAVILKGKSAPTPIFKPLGARRRPQQTTRREVSSLVGRDNEIDRILDELSRVGAGTIARRIVVVGDPGMGKSQLVAAIAARATAKAASHKGDSTGNWQAHDFGGGARVLVGAARSIEDASPFYPFREIFERILGISGNADDLRAGKELRRTLQRKASLQSRMPMLNDILGTDFTETQRTRHMTPALRAESLLELLVGLCAEATRTERLLIVIEDVQWMDSASWTLAYEISRRLTGLVLLLTSRVPEGDFEDTLESYIVTQVDRRAALRLRVAGLSKEHTAELIVTTVGADRVDVDVVDRVFESTAGNPFFTRELALSLIDQGRLRVVAGRCTFVASVGERSRLHLPKTVQGVVTARIDRLGPAQQLTLKVAAVVGRTFDPRLLRAAHPVAEDRPQIAKHLDQLIGSGFVAVDEAASKKRYLFSHAITQEAAYQLLLHEQRRTLHECVAEWLEDTEPDLHRRDHGMLAHHFERAGNREKALGYLEWAGDRASTSGAHREAINLMTRALTLYRAGTPNRSRLDTRVHIAQLERKLSQSYLALGQFVDSGRHARAALMGLKIRLPESHAGWRWSCISGSLEQVLHLLTGHAIERIEEGLAVIGIEREKGAEDDSDVDDGESRWDSPGSWDAMPWEQPGVELKGGAKDSDDGGEKTRGSRDKKQRSGLGAPVNRADLRARARALRRTALAEASLAATCEAFCAYQLGQTDRLLSTALMAINYAERSNTEGVLPMAYAVAGRVLGLGRFKEIGLWYLTRSLKTADDEDSAQAYVVAVRDTLAHRMATGAWEKSEALLDDAQDVAKVRGTKHERDSLTLSQAQRCNLAGQLSEAASLYREVLASAHARGDKHNETWAQVGFGESLLQMGAFADGLVALQAARAMLETHGDFLADVHSLGLVALGRMRSGSGQTGISKGAALAAVAAHERMGVLPPTLLGALGGYLAVAEVFTVQWRRVGQKGDAAEKIASRARAALRRAERAADRFPVAGPMVVWLRAEQLCAAGQAKKAVPLLSQALNAAQELEVPGAELELLLSLLNAKGVPDFKWRQYYRDARAVAWKMNATWHTRQLDNLRK